MKKIFLLCFATLLVATVLIWRAVAKPSRFGQFTGAPRAENSGLRRAAARR